MNLLTKFEWTEKVYREYFRIHGIELNPGEDKFWWYRISTSNKYMRLSEKGFERFKSVKIVFYEFTIPLEIILTPIILIGLSRMPSPYYFYFNSSKSTLYIAEEQIALLFSLQDNIELFAQGYV